MKHLEEFKLNENVVNKVSKDDPFFWKTYQNLRALCSNDLLGNAWDESGVVNKEFINKLIELKHYLNNIKDMDDIRKF